MSVYQLSSAERNVIRDYIRLGSLVKVAAHRCRSIKTIEQQVRLARKKCSGIPLVQLAILVDRLDMQNSLAIAPDGAMIDASEPSA